MSFGVTRLNLNIESGLEIFKIQGSNGALLTLGLSESFRIFSAILQK